MLLWLLIAILATLVAGALVFAARNRIVASHHDADANQSHFRAQLAEIEADVTVGRLSDAEAEAAKAELAREVLKFRTDGKTKSPATSLFPQWLLPGLALAGPLLGVLIYALVGQPGLPSLPLATRPPPVEITFDEAVAQIEARLVQNPDDIEGWQALAPAYMRNERFADAEAAFTRILELGGRDAETLTDVAEAKLMQRDGVAGPEILALLNEAVQTDPENIRARFYLAGEATRAGEWDAAISGWEQLIALSNGGEPWLDVARNGLAVANARGETPQPLQADPDQLEMIAGMVDQLASRLAQQGGTLEEWTRLVQSHLVLGDKESAAIAYRAAIAAYPSAAGREQLDGLAAEAGIVADE